jgi:guanyl-specific ribonuclease Sa
MRSAALYIVTASILFAGSATSCSQAEDKTAIAKPIAAPALTPAQAISPTVAPTQTAVQSTTPFVSNTAPPPVSRGKNLPPEGGDIPTEAEFDGYPYSYKKDGEKTVATFGARLLPADSDVVAGAVRDVIYRSYGDKIDSAPYIEGTGAARTIRIAGSKHQYLVVPTAEPTGEIHSLIITRQN